MRNSLPILRLLAIFSLLLYGLSSPALVEGSAGVRTPERPPQPPVSAKPQSQPLAAPLENLALPPLKAVLLVGPIDGDDGDWTLAEVANMEKAAKVLEENGVSVVRFYPGSGTFEEIEAAAEGAHFLLYRGHGVYDGNLPSPNVGGFSLSGGYYSPERMRANLHLAPNAIVMLYGCFTAGSSSAEGDQYDIGISEASRRVAQYSDPFFDIGAAGYYANWYGNAFEHFIADLFAGQTLGQTYENYFDFNAGTVSRGTHPDHPGLAMWVDKDNWGYWQYNNAFAGLPDQSLSDLFKTETLGGIPEQLDFVAEVADTVTIQPAGFTITPTNVSGEAPIAWSLSSRGDWIELSSIQGTSPDGSFQVSPSNFDATKPGLYTGAITVTAVSPLYTQDPIQVIDLSLAVLAPQLGGLPDELVFRYSIPDQAFLLEHYSLQPQNTGSPLPLEVSLDSEGDWLLVSPQNRSTPPAFLIGAAGFDTATAATYTGTITVTATSVSPFPVFRSPQVIPARLTVEEATFYRNYLPAIIR